MLRVIDRTIEQLELQNKLLTDQQRLTISMLQFWTQFRKDAVAGGLVTPEGVPPINQDILPSTTKADTPLLAPTTHPEPANPALDEIRSALATASGKGTLGEAVQKLQQPSLEAAAPLTDSFAGLQEATEMLRRASEVKASRAAAMPLEEVSPEQVAKQQEEEMRAHCLKELMDSFRQSLSPSLAAGAVGLLQPNGTGGMRQYSSDLNKTPARLLLSWPDGFYRSTDDKAIQMLVNLEKDFVVLPNVSNLEMYPIITSKEHGTPFDLNIESVRKAFNLTRLNKVIVDLRSNLIEKHRIARPE